VLLCRNKALLYGILGRHEELTLPRFGSPSTLDSALDARHDPPRPEDDHAAPFQTAGSCFSGQSPSQAGGKTRSDISRVRAEWWRNLQPVGSKSCRPDRRGWGSHVPQAGVGKRIEASEDDRAEHERTVPPSSFKVRDRRAGANRAAADEPLTTGQIAERVES
jgi:hypothetical protein